MKKVFGVLGDPIEHSLSPAMHNAAFSKLGMDCEYHAFRVRQKDLNDAILGAQAMGFGGLNITVPHKEKALEFTNPDSLARRIGAVNTISFNNEIRGHNTDGLGAEMALREAGVGIKSSNVVLAGAGGAARAIAFHFAEKGACITIANRTPEKAEALAKDVGCSHAGMEDLKGLLQDSDILINATSVGMHPYIDSTIASQDILHPDLTVFDIVYNPLQTKLLHQAELAGAKPIGGVAMLVHQGAEAFRIWSGQKPPVEVMRKAVLEGLG
ncbi:shikimate dehydrogenase [Methanohalophilus portucalensis]|uniref:Shikimate dehydrogenase (NADP(+)) n=2 Tax=Methanohalophilus portucalensis TaxID=39664 RepID=A0A1L9C5A3_9EURY|nr:shikimate dehydrogenase [Methanohalophilus portucalensis]ATU08369.1 shikimate dehydrogenase [Methanohalophilus portucalensis]OJH49700.1 shikimate dehydrogenase [Methanohalophilus portucalensis FDF-1]RNI13465.1 shikimate dehydrogenase [Methanohalophilus portucalensis FDF-1]SMH34479.1 shikimate dehydrogenase [Methanohalophilus portucalensis FDF-1]